MCTQARYSKIMCRNVHGLRFFFRFLSGESITFPFLNKFGSIHSHVQSIGFNVCRSVDGQADLLTGFNKLGGDHFTSKHLSIPWWLRQRTNKPAAESFSSTPPLDFLFYSSLSELKHYHSILCPLSKSELFMWDVLLPLFLHQLLLPLLPQQLLLPILLQQLHQPLLLQQLILPLLLQYLLIPLLLKQLLIPSLLGQIRWADSEIKRGPMRGCS